MQHGFDTVNGVGPGARTREHAQPFHLVLWQSDAPSSMPQWCTAEANQAVQNGCPLVVPIRSELLCENGTRFHWPLLDLIHTTSLVDMEVYSIQYLPVKSRPWPQPDAFAELHCHRCVVCSQMCRLLTNVS